MYDDLTGKKAIVTGAGSGIGRAIALKFAAEGCDVGIFDIDRAAAEETAALVRVAGSAAAVACGSVALRDDVLRAVDSLLGALGHVDILVNNAGVLRTAPFLHTPYEQWREVLSINLDGAYHFCQGVLPAMLRRGAGAIVNISSWTGKKGVPNHAAYSASKFALIGLTQSLASEFAARGIRVNAVCPGIIVDTHMREEAETLNRAQGLPDVETRSKMIPMQRAGRPDDIAKVVAFLSSAQSDYMTGQAVNVTGGLWMS